MEEIKTASEKGLEVKKEATKTKTAEDGHEEAKRKASELASKISAVTGKDKKSIEVLDQSALEKLENLTLAEDQTSNEGAKLSVEEKIEATDQVDKSQRSSL